MSFLDHTSSITDILEELKFNPTADIKNHSLLP